MGLKFWRTPYDQFPYPRLRNAGLDNYSNKLKKQSKDKQAYKNQKDDKTEIKRQRKKQTQNDYEYRHAGKKQKDRRTIRQKTER